jgi:hypothetical protein
MLANFLISASIAVVLIAALDVLLSKSQKDWLNLELLRLWDFLAAISEFKFLRWLESASSKRYLSIGAAVLTLIIVNSELWLRFNHPSDYILAAGLVTGAILASLLGPKVLNLALRKEGRKYSLLVAVASIAASASCGWIWLKIGGLFVLPFGDYAGAIFTTVFMMLVMGAACFLYSGY